MRKLWSLVVRKQTTLGGAAVVLMGMVIISGILGLIRLRILFHQFTPEETGIFFAAFRLPNLLFELLAMGSLTSAFIPVFTKYITKGEEKLAHQMAATVINLTAVILIVLTIPLMMFTRPISQVLAPGFTTEEADLMATYTRIMILLQVVPLIIGNFFTGILQSYHLFLVPAVAPVLYNAGIILGVWLFAQSLGLLSAVVGVGIGAVLFMAVQIPLVVMVGYRHKFTFSPKLPGVSELGKLMMPRIFGLAVSQIDVTVDLVLSSLLGAKMVSVFYLAQSLQLLPVRLFGSTISQASLPTLSQASAREDREKFKQSMVSAIHLILFFVLPASVFFIVLRIPIVRLVFGASRFDWEATVLTALTLSAFSVSMFAQAVSQALTRGFYALYDSKSPVIVGVFTMLVNIVLSTSFIFLFYLPVWALAVSTSLASILNALILVWLLSRKVGGFSLGALVVKPVKMVFAAAVAGAFAYIPMKIMDQLVFDTTRVFGLISLTTITGGLGLCAYVFLSWELGIEEVSSFFRIFERLKRVRTTFMEPASEIVTSE